MSRSLTPGPSLSQPPAEQLSMTKGQRKWLRIIVFERGGVKTPLEHPPALEFIEKPWLAFEQGRLPIGPSRKAGHAMGGRVVAGLGEPLVAVSYVGT